MSSAVKERIREIMAQQPVELGGAAPYIGAAQHYAGLKLKRRKQAARAQTEQK